MNHMWLALGLMCATFFSGISEAQEVAKRVEDFVKVARASMRSDKSDYEKSAEVLSAYRKFLPIDFPPHAVKSLSDNELAALFTANYEAVFVTTDRQFADNMAKLLTELQFRKKASSQQLSELFRGQIRVRDFEQARALALREKVDAPFPLPEFKSIGDVKDGTPAEWVVPKSGRVAELRAADLTLDWQVIVISHPMCHFSRRAMLDIYSDKVLKTRLEDRIKWIAPQDGSFDFDLIQKWNNQFPGMEISVVHLRKNWPLPNFTETPVFYFLSGGKVVTSFAGWPKEGNKEALLAGLNRINATK